jgi:hypothetical protein
MKKLTQGFHLHMFDICSVGIPVLHNLYDTFRVSDKFIVML